MKYEAGNLGSALGQAQTFGEGETGLWDPDFPF